MTFWSDMDSEMQLVPLDSDTADRLLAGLVAPEGAPAGYGRVVRLLEAASAEASSEELAREPETVAAMAAALRSRVSQNAASSRRSFMPFAFSRPRLTAAVLAAAFAVSGGMASAGSLPGAAQDVASEMLAKVGIAVPGASDIAGTRPGVRGNSASVPSAPARCGQGLRHLRARHHDRADRYREGRCYLDCCERGQEQGRTARLGLRRRRPGRDAEQRRHRHGRHGQRR